MNVPGRSVVLLEKVKLASITILLLATALAGAADEKPKPKQKVVLPADWTSIQIHTGGRLMLG